MATPTKAAALSQQLTKIARQWAPDTLRSQIQFGRFLESLAQHPNLTPQAVDAAKALQDNVMMKKYKLSNKMLKPASVPHHYERLMEGMEKSAKGIGRPWWKRFFGIW